MCYVGYRTRSPASAFDNADPALIDPGLPVDKRNPDYDGSSMTYWPSYSNMAPASRAAYLEWLSAGRPAGVNIGYVFLFFYGIERRILVDARATKAALEEVPVLISEVQRLLDLYGDNGSFRRYASDLIAASKIIIGSPDPSELTPPESPTGWDFPIELKLALGIMVSKGEPIPANWALSWALTSPTMRFRTPAKRCPEQLRALFRMRYHAKHGDGLVVRPNKSLLRIVYRPASSAFRGPVELTIGRLPDVTRLTSPLKKLNSLVEQSQNDLDGYSRWVGKTNDYHSMAAISLLPADMWSGEERAREFVSWIERSLDSNQLARVNTKDFTTRWFFAPNTKMAKRDAEQIIRFLEWNVFGIEPDIRFGGPSLAKTESVVLFRESRKNQSQPSQACRLAMSLARLGAFVAQSDGQISKPEEDALVQFALGTSGLVDSERVRLRAHVKWLVNTTVDLSGLKERISGLSEDQREKFQQLLVAIASADGQITSDELKTLSKLYRLLGIDPGQVYKDIHAIASEIATPASEPITILSPDTAVDTYTIPPQRLTVPDAITLSPERVSAILADTSVVSSVLSRVFEADSLEEDESYDQPDADAEEPELFGVLGESLGVLLRHVIERPVWPRYEFDELCERLDLMPSGAVERINDVAFSAFGELLLEGQDPVEVNTEILSGMQL